MATGPFRTVDNSGRWRCGRRPNGGAVTEYGGAGEEGGGAVVHDARRRWFFVDRKRWGQPMVNKPWS